MKLNQGSRHPHSLKAQFFSSEVRCSPIKKLYIKLLNPLEENQKQNPPSMLSIQSLLLTG